MNISMACSKCGSSLKAPESAAGRKTKCPKCGAVLLVPANSSGEDRHSPGPPPIPPELEQEHDPEISATFLPHDRTGITDTRIDRDRPLGVVLAALFSATNALSSFLLSILFAFVGTGFSFASLGPSGITGITAAAAGLVGCLLAMLALALAVLQAAVCFGLFTLQKWSYLLTLIVYGASGAVAVMVVVVSTSTPIRMLFVPQVAVPVAVFVYFSQPSLRRYFRR